MRPLPPPLLHLLDALAPLVDAAPLREALDALSAPWRVVVVGRVGVGKSTLVNLLAGDAVRRVGIGGVTDRTADVSLASGVVVVDTPGIDDEARALDELVPLLAEADAVVWVVDGLQPLTATERRIVDVSLVPGTPLHVVVSRLDLVEPEEAPAILERVVALTARHAPGSVRRLDLRTARQAPDDLAAEAHSSPRRARIVATAIEACEALLDALPPAERRVDLVQRARAAWTETVRGVEQQVAATLKPGASENKVVALDRLARSAEPARHAFLEQLAADRALGRLLAEEAPEMPLPEAADGSAVRQVLASLSGIEGARRVLRAAAARWLAEGEVALLDWLDGRDDLDEPYRLRKHALDALADAREALDGGLAVHAADAEAAGAG